MGGRVLSPQVAASIAELIVIAVVAGFSSIAESWKTATAVDVLAVANDGNGGSSKP